MTSERRKVVAKATLMLVLLCLIWGLTFPATKAAVETTDPIHFVTVRFLLATIILTPFLLFRRKSSFVPEPKPVDNEKGIHTKSVWIRGGIIGLLLLLGFSLQVYGMKYTTASRSGFFTGLLVVMVPIIAWAFRTSKTHWSIWLGLVPALIGTWLLADPSGGGMNRGDWLTIVSALTFATQMVVLESIVRDARQNILKLTYVQIVVIGAGALIWSLIEGNPFLMTPVGWAAAGYNALFGSIAAVWLQTRYQPDVPASQAALIFTLEPVFAAIFAWMLLGDSWTTRGLFGAALILSAMSASSYSVSRIEE